MQQHDLLMNTLTATMTKPQDHNDTDVQEDYPIDTSQIPTVVNTKSSDLATIQICWTYKQCKYSRNNTRIWRWYCQLKNLIDNHNTDSSLKDYMEVVYAFETTDGTPIDPGDGTQNNPGNSSDGVFLTLEEMEAYLNDGLEIVGQNVVFKLDNSRIVEALSTLPTQRTSPVYENINLDTFYAKWRSNDSRYIASDETIVNLPSIAGQDLDRSFRKWIDGEQFITAINSTTAMGNTNTYTIEGIANSVIDSSFLSPLDLQLEFSIDAGANWTTNLPDFMSADWSTQVNRFIRARVATTDATSNGD